MILWRTEGFCLLFLFDCFLLQISLLLRILAKKKKKLFTKSHNYRVLNYFFKLSCKNWAGRLELACVLLLAFHCHPAYPTEIRATPLHTQQINNTCKPVSAPESILFDAAVEIHGNGNRNKKGNDFSLTAIFQLNTNKFTLVFYAHLPSLIWKRYTRNKDDWSRTCSFT